MKNSILVILNSATLRIIVGVIGLMQFFIVPAILIYTGIMGGVASPETRIFESNLFVTMCTFAILCILYAWAGKELFINDNKDSWSQKNNFSFG